MARDKKYSIFNIYFAPLKMVMGVRPYEDEYGEGTVIYHNDLNEVLVYLENNIFIDFETQEKYIDRGTRCGEIFVDCNSLTPLTTLLNEVGIDAGSLYITKDELYELINRISDYNNSDSKKLERKILYFNRYENND